VTVLALELADPGEEAWQERMLLSPSASQLEREKRGGIVIYDGLKDTQISQAMNTQFDRSSP
jgi:hypothetical protein